MTPPRPAELPEPQGTMNWTREAGVIIGKPEDGYTRDQMLAYGLACIESALAPKAGAVAWRYYARNGAPTFAVDGSPSIPPGATPLYEHPPTQPEVRALVDLVRDHVADIRRCAAIGETYDEFRATAREASKAADQLEAALSALEKAE